MDIGQISTLVVLILSIVLHEVSHGYAANWLGDPTARLAGRLSPNPLLHIDPMGSVILPAMLFLSNAPFLFGWAKPVPYNPYNLNNQRWGEAIVAVAGPGANFLLALIFGTIIRFSEVIGIPESAVGLLFYIVYLNVFLGVFNLIPIHPLDGSKVLEPFLPLRARMQYHAFGERIERLGFLGMVLILALLVMLIGDTFFSFIEGITMLLTGVS